MRMNFLQLAYHFTGYYTRLQWEKTFIRKQVAPLVEQCSKKAGYRFSREEHKKILLYYPLFTILGVAENDLVLRRRKLRDSERWRLVLVSMMAALFDDLIDEEHWKEEDLLHLLHNRLEQLTLTPKANLILALNEELYTRCPPSAAYRMALEQGIHWQAASVRQLDKDISFEEVLLISRKKNGFTSFIFAYLLDEEWTEDELNFFYQTGILGQLVNDAYDLFKDIRDGIYTSLRKCCSVEEAEKLFIDEWKQLIVLLANTSAGIQQQRQLKHRLACMYGYGLVAFDQFKQAAPVGSLTALEKASRKQLVVDMELWPTRIKLLRAIIQISKIH